MAGKPEVRGRVKGSKYLTLPDGHRTTLVAGMADMLNMYEMFASGQDRVRLDAMLKFSNSYESDALRKLFDEYMNADGKRQDFLIAGCFVAALQEWCGIRK